jgi:hypothetical protein
MIEKRTTAEARADAIETLAVLEAQMLREIGELREIGLSEEDASDDVNHRYAVALHLWRAASE